MTKIQRSNFVQQFQGRNIDLDKVANDPEARSQVRNGGMTVDQLRRADRNQDGLLDAAEAFRVADHFDRDGSYGSLVSERQGAPKGELTQAGRSASVLGLMLGNASLQGEREVGENDDILFVGMGTETRTSAGAKHEIKELRKTGANVVGVMDSAVGNDKVRVGGQTYDLATDAGVDGFVQTLGLPEEQSQKIGEAIRGVGEDGKDEFAMIAQVWAKAEQGGSIPSRMVISGHHVGSAVWGDGNGRISWDNLQALSDAMPEAASQVKDLHLSACYSGGDAKFQKYQGIFPNVKTIWAYSGSAPGTGSGATHHQAAWERATRGGGTNVAGTAQNLVDRGWRKAENIDAGTINRITTDNGDLNVLRAQVAGGEETFTSFFSGAEVIQSSQRGPLREYYNQVQALLEQPGIPAEERRELEARRDQTIRTLYYGSHISHRFQEAHEHAIQEGFSAMGMTAPNFAEISRSEALELIRDFRDQVNEGSPAVAKDLVPLLNGLWNLDSRTIPETWI